MDTMNHNLSHSENSGKSTEETIEEVLDYFDFEKVLKTMQALDWKVWGVVRLDNFDVPELVGDLRKIARSLIKECIQKDLKELGAAGFRVEYDKDHKWLRLSFVVTDWDYPY